MEQLIKNFYQAFKELDGEKMVSYYHEDIVFEDPAFGVLRGEKAKAMWLMLCESQKGKKFDITYSNIKYNNEFGQAHWEAFYDFSKTGRPVHNKIDANFRFKDGLIHEHKDHFDLHRWAKQAIGFKGWLLGGTNFFKNKLQLQTNNMLKKYLKK